MENKDLLLSNDFLLHEIKNSVMAMSIELENLKEELKGKSCKSIESLENETIRMNDLVKRLGSFYKESKGYPESFDIVSFLEDLIKVFKHDFAITNNKSACISFDKNYARSVFENLLKNACESSEDTIEIVIESTEDSVSVQIMDRGPGIPEELRFKVFEPFFTTKENGTGVGLPLAKSLINVQGGTLELLPREGGGTIAKVVLPTAD